MEHGPNVTAGDYMASLVAVITQMENSEERDALVDHFITMKDQLNYLDRCYEQGTHETHRRI